jgi:hypothetical protein
MIVLTDTFQPVPRRVLIEDWQGKTLVTFWWGWHRPSPEGAWTPGYVLVRRSGNRWMVFKLNQPAQGGRIDRLTLRRWTTHATTQRIGRYPRLPTLAAAEMYIRSKAMAA